MLKKVATIAILTFSSNQNIFADTLSIAEVNQEKQQQVSWPGFIAQSFESQGLLCYEVVKTATDNNHKPIRQEFIDDARFISCADSKKDITKSSNRYVTVTGNLVGSVINNNHEYPLVMADKVRKWHYNYFDPDSVGVIKPRLNRNRLDFLINNRGQ